ncbi:MAG: PstC family ABC transporter permease, partial [Candidatus Dormibacteria bacterium]
MSVAVDHAAAGASSPRRIPTSRSPADILFRRIGTGAGLFTFLILGVIGLFLVIRALPAFKLMGPGFFTTKEWNPDYAPHTFGITAVLYWTVVIAVIALAIAVPLSIAAALFITEYAPRRARRTLTAFVDLLAAIPSVIYGIWGFVFLAPEVVGPSTWISNNLGFIPIFNVDGTSYAGSAFDAGLVLAFMVVPICTSIMRE